ncbi:MAG: outer membrane beta-barrel protein [Rhodothermales bacterium]|nr:outer membrane beta-barrel protein [Rhodothermales bacterium]MDG2017121.1 outer membrane beta-barrel protein [Rhodothermales bacterium]HAY37396.1 hypothetical protein [Bacteroidota bacterium]
MTRLTPIFCLMVITLLFAGSAQAQIRTEGGLALGVGVPQGEFGDQVDQIGFGGNIFGAVGMPGTPFMVGLDAGFMMYGHERRNEPFSTTIPDITVDVVTDNAIASGHFFVRLSPDIPVFRPYADALIGFKYFFTETRIQNENIDDSEIARSTNFSDTALSYGFGGGLQFRLFNGIGRAEGPAAVYLDLGARYLIGSEAAYLEEGSIRRENGKVTFDVTKSETTLLDFNLGVTVKF